MEASGSYVVDTLCSPGFYREMAPSYARFAALLAGVAPGWDDEGPRRAVELGCGLGFGTAVLAAANPGCAWTGVDFNSDHIAAATDLATAAGLGNLTYSDAAFGDHAPVSEVAYAALHGVYSWIGADEAARLRAVLRDALAVGALAYVSYNCQPGWAAAAPLRRLFAEHARRGHGTAGARAQAAVAFARTLADAGAGYFAANPGVADRLETIAGQDPRYLAHEYLNAAWRPLFHAEVVEELAGARLGYAAAADPTEAFADLSLPPSLVALVDAQPDPVMAETVRDVALNRQFRRDLFARGRLRLTGAERDERLLATGFVALAFPDDLRTAIANPARAYALVDRLWRDGPQPLSALLEPGEKPGGAGWDALQRLLAVLVHEGQIHPLARPPSRPLDDEARAAARRFNAAVCDAGRRGRDLAFFAAPLIGSGIAAGPLEQIVFQALLDDPGAGAGALADAVLPELERRGRPLIRDGRPIGDPAERRAELRARLELHAARRRPVWRALGVL